MQGLMQDWPLLISRLMDHAEHFHSKVEIVTETVEAGRHRYTYAECAVRSRKLAQALERLGINKGDRVATLAWNTYRHYELYYGISGSGAVCHTLNPRLFPMDIAWVANHAEDRMLFFDLTFLPLVRGLEKHFKTVKTFVMLTDKSNMPKSLPANYLCYEDLIDASDGNYSWPALDENDAASLCYTSGTTGHPKGVLYSHRSTVLHAMAVIVPDAFNLSATRTILPIIPMFHANAWGYPYTAAIVGCKLVLNGPHFDGKSIHTLIKEEQVHITTAVPTIWMGLLDYLKESGEDLEPLTGLGIGGAAAPASMIEAFESYGVVVHHAWGMTEMSPVGSMGSLNAETAQWPLEDQLKLKLKQGRGLFGVEMKIVQKDGSEAPWDGKTFGALYVRGPWTLKRYYRANDSALDEDGWFDTGDVATIDENGYMQITDRAKDVIKSGGEWISSIDLENAAMGHQDVARAAVIGRPHKKWRERPLLIVVLEEGRTLDKNSILEFLTGKVAKWWLPNDIVTVDKMPLSGTGKVKKTELRETFKDHKWPDEA
jgi:fatty-acyl-CoA synthase